ncbi:MAG: ferrous iron transport protein A [Candidatus Aenigmarchaeota archaeon]|nr:ferrous iron transport protein A [Candidatus Aenigmarchaeota archaeon]
METTLNKLEENKKARIVAIRGLGIVHRRLLDMGLVKGALIEVKKVAPLGDPIEVKIKGYNLSLRKKEAASITVDVI